MIEAQLLKQGDQCGDLRVGVGLGHDLVARIPPVRITAQIHQLDAYGVRIVAAHVVGHPSGRDVAINPAVAINVVVAAVASTVFMQRSFTVLAGDGQIRQFGAVDYHDFHCADVALGQLVDIGQRLIVDGQ